MKLTKDETDLIRDYRRADGIGRNHIRRVASLNAGWRDIQLARPRLKLYADGTVGIADAPVKYVFNVERPTNRADLVANIRHRCGTLTSFATRFGIRMGHLQAALDDRALIVLGGRAGTLRALLGLPVSSSASSIPLDAEVRIPIAALRIAMGGKP